MPWPSTVASRHGRTPYRIERIYASPVLTDPAAWILLIRGAIPEVRGSGVEQRGWPGSQGPDGLVVVRRVHPKRERTVHRMRGRVPVRRGGVRDSRQLARVGTAAMKIVSVERIPVDAGHTERPGRHMRRKCAGLVDH